jgi:membrane-bound serine protease (ClpP class)
LLFIGIVALYAELQMPGVGIGGFVACVAFLLFFWSKFTVQTADWLEVILFLGGVCFLLLEIFFLPGFGIFGLGGGLMIVASLVLASQTFILPHTPAEMGDLRRSVTVVCAAAMGAIVAGVAMRRYLPHAPMFNRMMLNPLDDNELAEQQQREAIVDFQHVLGCEGVTTTPLSPSGKAKVGDELLDVVSDGDAIEKGSAIVVVEVHGNRVVVKARDADKYV